MNNVCLIGNLTKDIEVRKTNSNKSVCGFTIGVRREYKNEKGEYDSDFVNCLVWEQGAEYLGKYAHKGDRISVVGKIQTRNYDDKDGKKVYVTEVVCNKVEIVHTVQPKNSTVCDTKVDDQRGIESVMSKKNDNEITFDTDDLPFY